MSEIFPTDEQTAKVQAVLDKVTLGESRFVTVTVTGPMFSTETLLLAEVISNGDGTYRYGSTEEGIALASLDCRLLDKFQSLQQIVLLQIATVLLAQRGPDAADDLMCDGVSVGKQIKAFA